MHWAQKNWDQEQNTNEIRSTLPETRTVSQRIMSVSILVSIAEI